MTTTAAAITARINAFIADDEMFEEGEPRPSSKPVDELSTILTATEALGVVLPSPDVCAFYEDISVTWDFSNVYLRIVAHSSPAPPVLYLEDPTFSRGKAIDCTAANLKIYLTPIVF